MNNDGQLLKQYCEQGDQTAMTALCDLYQRMVYSICMKVLRNVADAEDATVATFKILANKAAKLTDRESLAGWLCWCANNTARNLMRLRQRVSEQEKEVTQMQTTVDSADMPESFKTMLPALDAELSNLPAIYREVLVLQYYNGLSRTQIADKLGRPEGTVATWIRSAITTLRKRLAKYQPGGSAEDIEAQLGRYSLLVPVSFGVTVKLKALVEGQSISQGAGALAELTLKTMAWAQMKNAIVVGSAAAVLVGGGVVTTKYVMPREQPAAVAATGQDEILYDDLFKDGRISDFWAKVEPRGSVFVVKEKESALMLAAKSKGSDKSVVMIESRDVPLGGKPVEVFWERVPVGMEHNERSKMGVVIEDASGKVLCRLHWQMYMETNGKPEDRIIGQIGDGKEASYLLGSIPKFLRIIVEPSGRVVYASKRQDMEQGEFFAKGDAGRKVAAIRIRFESVAGPGGEENALMRHITVRRMSELPEALSRKLK
ncbi:MAG: hypothetical protein C0404_11855 [Verrucomicrobia bacterium]|nr:hypothetical protein [Verrucomicrobiota bacterium]